MNLIEIANLNKSFGAFRAVSDVSLSVGQSEFVTFLGPSGCGKTTTLRLLAGFMTPELELSSCVGLKRACCT